MPTRVLVERTQFNIKQLAEPSVKCARQTIDKANEGGSECRGASIGEWRVLESGVLATPTSIEVVTERDRRRVWLDLRGGGRLVCPHGWGAYHLSGWNGPRAHLFPKPDWTTCDCRSATGLCGGRGTKRQRCELVALDDESSGESSGCESDRTVVAAHGVAKVKPPSYYETLVAQHGTTELRPGLVGAHVPGMVGSDGGGAFYMVKGDRPNVLRCRHGQTTNTLATQARERRRWAACLVAAAVFGRKQRRVSVLLLLTLQSTREARRIRRGGTAPCGCAPAHVKACVLACAR